MIRTLVCFALSSALGVVAHAQSLREAVKLMLAEGPEPATEMAAASAIPGCPLVVRSELLSNLNPGTAAGTAALHGDTLVGTSETSGEDLVSRQLSISLLQFLQEAATGAGRSRAEKRREAMRGCLDRGMLEARVVDLVAVYFELLRIDRKMQEAERLVESCESLQADLPKSGEGAAGGREEVERQVLEAADVLVAQQVAWKRAQDRFQRLVGRRPEGLGQPPLPELPGDVKAIDLSRNWNYLAATEAVMAAGDGPEGPARERLPALFLAAGRAAKPGASASEAAAEYAERSQAWRMVKAGELQRAADLQRRYALGVLWRERQADVSAVNALRVQAAMLASEIRRLQPDLGAGRMNPAGFLSLQRRLSEVKMAMVDAESNQAVRSFRILGVQGRCVEFVMGEEVADLRFAGSAAHGGEGGRAQGLAQAAEQDPAAGVEDRSRAGVLRALRPVEGQAGAGSADNRALAGVAAWIEVAADGRPAKDQVTSR